jgi:hypothetical protein
MEITVDVPGDLLARLDTMASRLGQDTPELVLRLIKSYLSTALDPSPEPQLPDNYFEQRADGSIRASAPLESAPPAAANAEDFEPDLAVETPAPSEIKRDVPAAPAAEVEPPPEPVIRWLLGHKNSAPEIPVEALSRRTIYANRS